MKLKLHKEAQKNLNKAPKYIREKAFGCIIHLRDHGMKDCPYPIDTLKGPFKKFNYYEVKIHKDYRLFFRFDKDTLYIRKAGTHNQLGTG